MSQTVYRSCQFEFALTLHKRNDRLRQVFVRAYNPQIGVERERCKSSITYLYMINFLLHQFSINV